MPPGIVTGLRAEAAIARRLSALVGCTGGRTEAAAVTARQLVERGASVLVSFGICGGLAPGLASGTIVVATAVMTRDRPPVPCDAELQARLAGGLAGAIAGPIFGGDRVVDSVAGKAELFRLSGALGVDLESGPVARVAAESGRPLAVIRAIADDAATALPPAALVGLTPTGGIALGAVLESLARAPGQLPALLRAARDTRAALRALFRGACDLRAGLGVA